MIPWVYVLVFLVIIGSLFLLLSCVKWYMNKFNFENIDTTIRIVQNLEPGDSLDIRFATAELLMEYKFRLPPDSNIGLQYSDKDKLLVLHRRRNRGGI